MLDVTIEADSVCDSLSDWEQLVRAAAVSAIAESRFPALAYNGRGEAHSAKGDVDRAIADLNQAISLDPKSALAFNDRCWALVTLVGDLRQALGDCDQSLRLKPNDANALDSRGLVFLKLGRLDDLETLDYASKETIELSLCGLGQTAPIPHLNLVKYFRAEFEDKIRAANPAPSLALSAD